MSDPIKKIPLKDLKKLITAHYAASLLIDTALRDVQDVPKKPYQLALSLFGQQLEILLETYKNRTNEAKTEKMLLKIIDECNPALNKEESHG